MTISNIMPRGGGYELYGFPQHSVDVAVQILEGLQRPQKTIDPKFFYDVRGTCLYEKITQTPEYYLTRTENEILCEHATAIAELIGRPTAIFEPGAGNCRKVEYLLDALRPAMYMPVDVSCVELEMACTRLTESYSWLKCIGVVAEFCQIEHAADLLPNCDKLIFFPGSTLGNLEPVAAMQFLKRLRQLIGFEGGMLIGVDNIKDEAILHRAYNDRAGITAAFNRNVLVHINRVLGADFVPENFAHRAFFNREQSRIEMHLVSQYDQTAHVANHSIHFRRDETIHTENSYKYTRTAMRALAAEAGLQCRHTWHDPHDYFTLYYFVTDPDTVLEEAAHSES